ncbi:DUF1858 domain-containing protein [candidate division KSB1 bacterium]|nr:DUF1858 domain-containing protein [candidate division KSB1 bacterium]
MKNAKLITPDTKVSTLLDEFPELEPVLIEMAPEFGKLKNPILRKTVAKVATLSQVAKIGNIPLGDMINTLRRAAGIEGDVVVSDEDADQGAQPAWFNANQIVDTLDARPMLEAGEHPLGIVMARLKTLQPNEIYELLTPFLPAPMIDKARQQGYRVWSTTEGELAQTYFTVKD